ncbi:MAG: mce2E [Marmoricola sp.]|nr:mce2E [Marmoricola sp.]
MDLRRLRIPAVLIASAVFLGGCSFNGIENMQLPGGVGTGAGSLKITVDLPDVGTLTPNAQVKVGDIAVGTVTKITAVDWHAVAVISIDGKTRLPANAVATVGVNSLLGASYLELAAPTDEAAEGQLASGSTIPLSRGSAYPATEQVLSAASVVLNGGGLAQLGTITSELGKAFNPNNLAVRDLLPRINTFVTALDAQKEQIYSAIDSVDQLSARFAHNKDTLTRSIDELGPALATLSRERPRLTAALASLKNLGSVATPLVESTRADLVANLRNLAPALAAIHQAGASLVRGLGFAVTFPFAPETMRNACRGDYCNLDLVLDLTNNSLVHGFTTQDGLPSIPGFPGMPTVPQLVSLLGGFGLGGVVSGLGGLLGGLTSGLTGRPATTQASSSASRPVTPTVATRPGSASGGLAGLLGGLLSGGGGSKGARS